MQTKANIGEKVLHNWTGNCFLKKMGPFEKRLMNWWLSEGFFNISNIKESECGVCIELMLLLGDSIYNVIGVEASESESEQRRRSIDKKINDGWNLMSAPKHAGYYLVLDTPANKNLIQVLLTDNLRSFKIVDFKYGNSEEQKYIKSVVIDVYRKKRGATNE